MATSPADTLGVKTMLSVCLAARQVSQNSELRTWLILHHFHWRLHRFQRHHFSAQHPAESARRISVMLCQRFERRMRQCGAFELRISTRVARTNQPKLTEPCQQHPASGLQVPKKLPSGSCAKPTRITQKANSAMTVLCLPIKEGNSLVHLVEIGVGFGD